MTVYFNKRRQRWCYDFEYRGKRHFGYAMLEPDGTPATNREEALIAEKARRTQCRLDEPQRDRSPIGRVYFAATKDRAFVKIGWSKNVRKRLSELRTSSPVGISLLGNIRGTLQDEKFLHKQFEKWRTHREWFAATPEVLEAIKLIIDREKAASTLREIGILPPDRLGGAAEADQL